MTNEKREEVMNKFQDCEESFEDESKDREFIDDNCIHIVRDNIRFCIFVDFGSDEKQERQMRVFTKKVDKILNN